MLGGYFFGGRVGGVRTSLTTGLPVGCTVVTVDPSGLGLAVMTIPAGFLGGRELPAIVGIHSNDPTRCRAGYAAARTASPEVAR